MFGMSPKAHSIFIKNNEMSWYLKFIFIIKNYFIF
jgi:hypothetical protein